MRFRLSGAFVLAVAGAISISCGGIVDPSQNTVDTFTGTIGPGGSLARPFTASKTGEITVKMLTLTPASISFIGVEWVQASGSNCGSGLLQNNTVVPANTTAISGQIPSGDYCIIVYDSVGLPQPANFSVTISHP
jgi:hypothetical protein